MACLDEFYFSLSPVKRAKYTVDAVAGIAKDASNAPGIETIDEKVANCCGHGMLQEMGVETTEIAMCIPRPFRRGPWTQLMQRTACHCATPSRSVCVNSL
jgi:hypothetical protein